MKKTILLLVCLTALNIFSQKSATVKVTHFPGNTLVDGKSKFVAPNYILLSTTSSSCLSFLDISVYVKASGNKDKPYKFKFVVTNNSNYKVNVNCSKWGLGNGGQKTVPPGESRFEINNYSEKYQSVTISKISFELSANDQQRFGLSKLSEYLECNETPDSYIRKAVAKKQKKDEIASLKNQFRSLGDSEAELKQKIDILKKLQRVDTNGSYGKTLSETQDKLRDLENNKESNTNSTNNTSSSDNYNNDTSNINSYNTNTSNNNNSYSNTSTNNNQKEKSYEEVLAENNAKIQRMDANFNAISNQMSSLFADGIQGSDFYTLSTSFAEKGMETEAYTSLALGTALNIGGQIFSALKQARAEKIKTKISNIEYYENKFKDEIKTFNNYLKNNDYNNLIASHKNLLSIELNSLKEADWLRDKHSSDFLNLQKKIAKRQKQRIKLIVNLNTELFKKAVQNMTDKEIFNSYLIIANKEIRMHLTNEKRFPLHDWGFQEDYIRNLGHFIYSNRFERLEVIEQLFNDNKVGKTTFLTLSFIERRNIKSKHSEYLRDLFLTSTKEEQLQIILDMLEFNLPNTGTGYYLKYHSLSNYSRGGYDFDNIELLLNDGLKGLNYYFSYKNNNGELVPLYEHINKVTIRKNAGLTGNRRISRTIKSWIKQDMKHSGKDRETLFKERGDCLNPVCREFEFDFGKDFGNISNERKNTLKKDIKEVNKLIANENHEGLISFFKEKNYSESVLELFEETFEKIEEKAFSNFKSKNYKVASNLYYTHFNLTNTNRSLYNSAAADYHNKDYMNALKKFKKLKETDYEDKDKIEKYIKKCNYKTNNVSEVNIISKETKTNFNNALKLFNEKKYNESISLLRNILNINQNYGKAFYLLGLNYYKIVNPCGRSEFEKRMVFVSALNQMHKALETKNLTPKVVEKVNYYIKFFRANLPSKKLININDYKIGDKYKINCLINEEVKVISRD